MQGLLLDRRQVAPPEVRRVAGSGLGFGEGACGVFRPMAAPRLRSLFECLGEVPECRRDRGKRYPLNTVLAIAG